MSQPSTTSPDPGAAVRSLPTQRRRRGRTTEPPAPLGSLTQREHRVAVGCAACGSTRLTHLKMMLTDGTPVRFTSCHRCEHRSWTSLDGEPLSVDSVLDRARKAV
ncbi:hypothetical protein ACFP6A_13405 [Quadrisphaera sp. GCM10027208]|uniref:hypothetical protein n=1 Tax=Quadrisphaera sp. GCM10027208 TaxID=3273423 RepID=UPI00360939AA